MREFNHIISIMDLTGGYEMKDDIDLWKPNDCEQQDSSGHAEKRMNTAIYYILWPSYS